jgi:TonB family protein
MADLEQAFYPSVPAQNQMEGYVLAEFDITPDGSVENINIIKSVPVLLF